jgi:hypothetical protein
VTPLPPSSLTDEEEKLAALETSFQQIKNVSGCGEVEDIAKKFMTRRDTNQHLRWMVEEVRSNLEGLKRANEDLRQRLKVLGSAGHVAWPGRSQKLVARGREPRPSPSLLSTPARCTTR